MTRSPHLSIPHRPSGIGPATYPGSASGPPKGPSWGNGGVPGSGCPDRGNESSPCLPQACSSGHSFFLKHPSPKSCSSSGSQLGCLVLTEAIPDPRPCDSFSSLSQFPAFNASMVPAWKRCTISLSRMNEAITRISGLEREGHRLGGMGLQRGAGKLRRPVLGGLSSGQWETMRIGGWHARLRFQKDPFGHSSGDGPAVPSWRREARKRTWP